MNRQERLAPNDVPRWIRCYDNGGETADRYTVVFTGRYRSRMRNGLICVLGMSAAPYSPQGICICSSYRSGQIMEGNKPSHWPPTIGRKGNLGTRIHFEQLPFDCQRAVWQDYADLWDIEIPKSRC